MAQSSSNIPWGSPSFTDLANGTVDLNAVQTAIRPIQELGIMTRNLVDPNADYEVVYDASTGNHVRVAISIHLSLHLGIIYTQSLSYLHLQLLLLLHLLDLLLLLEQ